MATYRRGERGTGGEKNVMRTPPVAVHSRSRPGGGAGTGVTVAGCGPSSRVPTRPAKRSDTGWSLMASRMISY